MDNVQDLITHAYDQKPLEFQTSFSNLLADRLVKAVSDKKVEVAQSMFREQEPEAAVEIESDTQIDQKEVTDGATA